MNASTVTDILGAAFFVAAIFVLVRPRSQGPQLVNSVSNGVIGLVKAATGGGSW